MSGTQGEEPPAYEPRDDTVYIILIGLTGSGKSTFINLASGSNLRTSKQLDSCTQDVEAAPTFEFEGRQICLIDTPGFDDTDRSEVEILRTLNDFLADQYQDNILLHGIIYLQRISDVRMGGVSTRTLRMFRQLCGSESLKNMTIATNMWSKETVAEQESRERQLREDERFFKPLLDDHAIMVRHDNTLESAHRIIGRMCNNSPLPLAIQRETVDETKALSATSAGIMLRSGLLEPAHGLQVLVEGLQERIKAARAEGDQVKAAELRAELWEMVPRLARLYNELKNLQALTGKEKVDVVRMWSKMDPKAQIISVFRRSCGAERDTNSEMDDFWAALGDTIAFFKEALDFFEQYPLPLSVHEQLLRDTGALTPEASEKFDQWMSHNRKEIKTMRNKVRDLVSTKAVVMTEEGDANQSKKENPNQTKKQKLADMRTRLVNSVKRGSGRLIPGRGRGNRRDAPTT